MAYLMIEASVRTHPKFLKAGPAACWLWVCGLGYCQEGLTNGFIPVTALSYLGIKRAPKLAKTLVSVRLWEQVEGGFVMHDYLEHNKSADEIREIMRKRREGGKKGGRPAKPSRLPSEANLPENPVLPVLPVLPVQDTTEPRDTGRGLAFKGETFKVTQKQLEVVFEHLGPRAEAFDLRWLSRWDKQGKPAGDLLTWLKAKADDEIRKLPLMRSLERDTGGLAEWVVECAAMKHGNCSNQEQHEQRKREAS